jgi:hypothetical protein
VILTAAQALRASSFFALFSDEYYFPLFGSALQKYVGKYSGNVEEYARTNV